MANHRSAIKRARQIEKRTIRNRALRSRLRTFLRRFTEMAQGIADGSKEAASAEDFKAAYNTATQEVRKAGSKGILASGTVDRRVARLAARYNKLTAAAA